MAVVQYTFTHTIHRTTQSTQTIYRTTQLTNLEECGFVPRLCELFPGICFITEEKAQENLSQGRWRIPVGMMKTEYTEQSIQTIEYINITIRIHMQGISLLK